MGQMDNDFSKNKFQKIKFCQILSKCVALKVEFLPPLVYSLKWKSNWITKVPCLSHTSYFHLLLQLQWPQSMSQSPLPLQSEISTTTLFPQSTFKLRATPLTGSQHSEDTPLRPPRHFRTPRGMSSNTSQLQTWESEPYPRPIKPQVKPFISDTLRWSNRLLLNNETWMRIITCGVLLKMRNISLPFARFFSYYEKSYIHRETETSFGILFGYFSKAEKILKHN